MKATDLEAKLAELIRQHGDLEVYVDDADTSWLMRLANVEVEDGIVTLSSVGYHDREGIIKR